MVYVHSNKNQSDLLNGNCVHMDHAHMSNLIKMNMIMYASISLSVATVVVHDQLKTKDT